MSKVALLAINAKFVHSSLAVWVLAGGIKKYAHIPHEVEVFETTIHQENSEIVNDVVSNNPDVVGISTYIWNAKKLPELLKLLKEKLPKTVIILGGPEASNNSNYWLEHGADYVLQGECEQTFPFFLDTLENIGFSGAEILRTVETNEEVELRKPIDPIELDELIASIYLAKPIEETVATKADIIIEPIDPYSDTYFEALNGRIAYIESSRGCPYQCSFCLSSGRGVDFFPLDIVKEQLLKLSRSGTKTIKFVDRTFNCNSDRACELFKYIIELDTTCCFHFEVAADLFDEYQLSILSQAPPGRIQFESGIQSYHSPALKATSRQMNIEKTESNILRLLDNKNIHMHIDLIAGLPYETLPDFQVGFDRAFALKAHTLQLGFLKLLHGSVIREQADEYHVRYNPNPPYEITSSPWLNTDELQSLRDTENALQHTYNKSRFLSTLQYVISISRLSPFSVFHALGVIAPNHGTHLTVYAQEVYDCFVTLPNVIDYKLRDCMVCDWLGMAKGRNLPQFLKNPDTQHTQLIKVFSDLFGHTVARDEVAVLRSGACVAVDSSNRDPVTGLYCLKFVLTYIDSYCRIRLITI